MNKEDIIKLIPSNSLKEAIRRENFNLSDSLLFKIGYLYSKTLEDRLDICRSFIDSTIDLELKTNISNIYTYLNKGIDEFKRDDLNSIYIIKIEENSRTYTTYLGSNYSEALDKLKLAYLEDYDNIDKDKLSFTITKKTLYPVSSPNWINDFIGTMYYDSSFIPKDILFKENSILALSFKEELLIDKLSWVRLDKLPRFFKNLDIVKFDNQYGVVLNDQDDYRELVGEVVPLDSPYINDDMDKPNESGIYSVLEQVRLVPFCELEVIEENKLPLKYKDSYRKFIRFDL